MPFSPFYEAKLAGYRKQRSVSKGASITLVSGCGEWKTSFDCATRATAVLGSRGLDNQGDGILESIPVLSIPVETSYEAIHKLTARYSVALVDIVCSDSASTFVLLWKIEQRVAEPPAETFDPNQEEMMLT